MPDGSLHLATLPSRRSLPSRAHEYHCVAQNRYGRLVSRRARVQLASLSRFHQHPESVEVERGGVARFQCLIQGVPEPSISWEHNGTALNTANHRVTLLPSGILHITSVSQADVGTYRCVARNVASTHHSQDAQLTLSVGPPRLLQEPEILSGPQNLTLTVHQTAVLECIATGHPWPLVSWSRLDGRSIGVEGIQVLGTENLMISDMSVQHSGVYVCATNRPGTRVWRTAQGVLLVQEPSGPELQEAVSKGTSEHIFSNLEPATAYTIHLRAYSAEGASQDSAPIFASTTGSTPAALGFSTKVFNATSVQASWELPPQLGPIQGFKLFHRKLPAAHFEGPLLLASSVSSFLYTDLGEALNLLVPLKARLSQCDLAPGTELPGPEMPVPFTFPCSLQNQLPSMRSSCRRSMAMGMEIAVPALSHCVMCPRPLLMAQCPQSPRLGALAARVRAAHCLGLWWASMWAWLPSSFASSASSWAGDIASSANRSPRNAGQCLGLPRTELGAVKARLRVEGSQGRRLNSPPRVMLVPMTRLQKGWALVLHNSTLCTRHSSSCN
ncbi:immunoglobulin superfamily DCC subclass member 3-like isoform X2 [Pongo abelii]|uniref:immunoglobulin superfamily DCC subclass member 3-like isoform X2 n=1 Tax=Pongo abelii TaxID=9601 RepID=UPI0023E8D633|nr:immunoglobulin superfamily DCC subclass member 3-like isoform X2 [Pongo abelii]